MRADPGFESHRVAHQAANAAIAVRKGMDVVQAMVGRRDRDDLRGCAQCMEVVPLLEISHEGADTFTRWRQMTANGVVVLGPGSPFARRHHELTITRADAKHFLRRACVELAVQPANELARRWCA